MSESRLEITYKGELQKWSLEGELQKWSLDPSDVIVLRLEGRITEELSARLRVQLEGKFPGHAVIVLGDGMTLDIVAKDFAPRITVAA
jgi:hypothetical protein